VDGAEAQQQRDQILADAEAQAKDIRAQAEAEAAQYYSTFAKNESLAIFLRRLEGLRRIAINAQASGQPITLVLSTKSDIMNVLDKGPAIEGIPAVPVPDIKLSADALPPALSGPSTAAAASEDN